MEQQSSLDDKQHAKDLINWPEAEHDDEQHNEELPGQNDDFPVVSVALETIVEETQDDLHVHVGVHTVLVQHEQHKERYTHTEQHQHHHGPHHEASPAGREALLTRGNSQVGLAINFNVAVKDLQGFDTDGWVENKSHHSNTQNVIRKNTGSNGRWFHFLLLFLSNAWHDIGSHNVNHQVYEGTDDHSEDRDQHKEDKLVVEAAAHCAVHTHNLCVSKGGYSSNLQEGKEGVRPNSTQAGQ
mmetsp:Transcript_11228/g.15519  ORF Transcript_11228/g.15519 Transcript_11228/m.15519 type:complete len:241 (+) Transcript_11228:652-1374(+)